MASKASKADSMPDADVTVATTAAGESTADADAQNPAGDAAGTEDSPESRAEALAAAEAAAEATAEATAAALAGQVVPVHAVEPPEVKAVEAGGRTEVTVTADAYVGRVNSMPVMFPRGAHLKVSARAADEGEAVGALRRV